MLSADKFQISFKLLIFIHLLHQFHAASFLNWERSGISESFSFCCHGWCWMWLYNFLWICFPILRLSCHTHTHTHKYITFGLFVLIFFSVTPNLVIYYIELGIAFLSGVWSSYKSRHGTGSRNGILILPNIFWGNW